MEGCYKYLRQIVLILVPSFAIFVPLYFNVFFDVEDLLSCLIVSGAYIGVPDAHTVYLGYGLGHMLSYLYSIDNSIEWYTLIYVILNAISLYFITIKITQIKCNIAVFCSLIVFWMSVVAYVVLCPQFLILAFQYGLASILMAKGLSKKNVLCIVILFFIGCEVRLSACLLAWALLLPYLIIPIRLTQKDYWKKITVLFVLFTIALGVHFSESYIYKGSKQWTEWYTYDVNRQYLQDNPARFMLTEIEEDNIKRQALELMQGREGTIYDMDIIDAETTKDYCDTLKSAPFSVIKYSFSNYLRNIDSNGYTALFILMMITMWLLLSDNVKLKQYIYIVISFCLILIYMMITTEPKDRITISMFLSVYIASYLLLCSVKMRKHIIIVLVILNFFLFCKYNLHTYREYNSNLAKYELTLQAQQLISKDYPKVMVISAPLMLPCKSLSKQFISSRYLRHGWISYTPHNTRYYSGVLSFVEQLPLISRKEFDTVYRIQKIIKDKYGISTYEKILAETENIKLVILETSN